MSGSPIEALDLAALLCSRVCHDLISPVGAIVNGLEVLEEAKDEETKTFALDLIRKSATTASAKLQFCRIAFGAAGSAGAQIDLRTAEQISKGFVGKAKHKLDWKIAPGYMGKDKVKLLLNLVASSVTALPRGGDIEVAMTGSFEVPSFVIRCKGTGARSPQHLAEFISGEHTPALDAMTIQAYYTWRLACTAGMHITIIKDGADIVLAAQN